MPGRWRETTSRMRSSTTETPLVRAETVIITDDTITAELSDGRSISVPLAWYARLVRGSSNERSNWRVIGGGPGLHWPEREEDVSVGNLQVGQASGESQQSLKRWLSRRASTNP